MIIHSYLVVRANGEVRTSKQARRLATDEIAIPIKITLPDAWGGIDRTQAIELKLPGPARIEQLGKPARGTREP